MRLGERRIGECFLHDALAIVEGAAHCERPHVAAPARELLRLQLRDAALRIQHHDVDPRLAMKCRSDCAARVAGSRDQHRQLAPLTAPDALHARGKEPRAEILERAGRAVKQLQHRQRRRCVRQADQRRRKIEGFVTDRRHVFGEWVVGCERRQQARADLRQLHVGLEVPRREMREFLRNVQPAVGRDAARNSFAERDGVVGVACADVLHEGAPGVFNR